MIFAEDAEKDSLDGGDASEDLELLMGDVSAQVLESHRARLLMSKVLVHKTI